MVEKRGRLLFLVVVGVIFIISIYEVHAWAYILYEDGGNDCHKGYSRYESGGDSTVPGTVLFHIDNFDSWFDDTGNHRYRPLQDKVSSLKFSAPPYEYLELCEHANFGGICDIYHADTCGVYHNDIYSSARVVVSNNPDEFDFICRYYGKTWFGLGEDKNCCNLEGEKFNNNPGTNYGCCWNGTLQPSDHILSNGDGGIMCFNGQFYGCRNTRLDIATRVDTGDVKGSFICVDDGDLGHWEQGADADKYPGYCRYLTNQPVPPGPDPYNVNTKPNGCCGDDGNGYQYEFIAGYIFSPYLPQPSRTVPLYRFRNTINGDHFYSTDSNIPNDYTPEPNPQAPIGYIYDTQSPGTVPLYRFYNTQTGHHFYTASEVEKASLPNPPWNLEPTTGYIYNWQYPGTFPFYRLYGNEDHLYTLDPNLENTDLGYIGPASKQFFCNYEPIQSIPKWNWFDATSNELYKIHQVLPKVVDVISNTQNWSYCNADNTGLLNGTAVGNYQTFLDALPNGQCWCDIPDGYEVTSDCSSTSKKDCCYSDTPPNPMQYPCDEDPKDRCGKCWNADGTPYEPLEGGGGSEEEEIPKEGFGFGYQFTGYSNMKCENQPVERGYSTKLCKDTEKCENGYFISASDGKCCYGQSPYCSTGNRAKTCAEQNGELIPVTNEIECTGTKIDSSDTDEGKTVCCYGGYYWKKKNILPAQGSKSFICYQNNNKNLFGECCSGADCYNVKLVPENDNTLFDNGNLFTTGSPLHTIASFNKVKDGAVGDYLKRINMSYDQTRVTKGTVVVNKEHTDFTPYDFLEFDIGYIGRGTISNISFYNKNDIELWTAPLADLTIDGSINSNMWHHVIVDLKATGKDLSDVAYIKFPFKKSPSREPHDNGESFIYLDNFFLKTKSQQPADPLNYYYCTGAFRTWIKELNPINFNPDNFNSYGPYWYACDSQLSFSWTGKRCCGSLSTVSNINETKEFYNDTWSGCFGGVTIHHDERVSDSFRNPAYYPDIMYYNSIFYQCGGLPRQFFGITRNINGQNIQDNITTNVSAYFTVRGSYYCALDNRWRNLSDISKTRIIASSLFNYTMRDNRKRDFTLFCENANESINDPSLVALENVQNFCVLRYNESSGENIIVGVGVNDLETFLNNINDYIKLINSNDISEITQSEIDNCNAVRSDDQEFYKECISRNGLDLFYNDKFKIVIFSQKPIEGWHKGFFQNIWEFLMNLFKNLFGNPNRNEDVVAKIPILESYAAFDRLYIANYSGRFVKAIAEDVYEDGNTTIDVDYENINLTNVTDISYIETHSRKITFSKRTETSGELIIEKPQNADLFTYLTAINRFEVYQGGGGGGNGNENQN